MRAGRLRIEIVTPARPGSRAGNRVTARRWATLLRSLGHQARITTSWQGRAADVLIALHAQRSYDSVRRFREAWPDRPLVVALTGTDVYRDIHQQAEAQASLRLASRLVVLQEGAVRELPPEVRRKARVILQSAEPRSRKRPAAAPLRLVVAGHLRAEKDPFRLVEALAHVPEIPVEVLHAGRALESAFEIAARSWMRREARYRWLGELPAARIRQMIADGDALVLSSVLEGGANVISEAVVCGVPILASRISSTVALLGEDYPAYFEVGNSEALASLIRRFTERSEFRRKLVRHVRNLRHNFTPRRERQAWRKLLAELIKTKAL